MNLIFRFIVSALLSATVAAPVLAEAPADDWPTWGYDQERTAWNQGENKLSKANVGKLKVQWSAQLPIPVRDVVLSTMTAPIVVSGVSTPTGPLNMLVVLGADDTLYALNADSGQMLWSKRYSNPVTSTKKATWLCPNTANDTPTVDKARAIVFFMTSDGKLRGLSLADGTERLVPIDAVPPFTRAWSLNLIGHVVYTTSGRACGELTDPNSPMYAARNLVDPFNPAAHSTDPSAATAIDVGDLQHPVVTSFFLSNGRPAAPWGRGGLARGPNDSLILETSDGIYDPAAGQWGDTIVRLTTKAARVIDSFTPENHIFILQHDLGGSASPAVFPFGEKTLVAVAQKEGVLRILDANNLGGGLKAQHQMPVWQSTKLGNDKASGTDPSQGTWGGISTYQTADGKRFLYLPMWGPISTEAPKFPVSHGDAPNGSIMAFEVVDENGVISAQPRWMSGDMIMADPPTVANGVVYATSTGGQAAQNPRMPDGTKLSSATAESAKRRSTPAGNLILYAFDAETGKQLYSSKDTIKDWVHFSEPVVALGRVYLATHDGHIYAFGPRGAPKGRSSN
jgi:outer membrane protein assembly factor BamB